MAAVSVALLGATSSSLAQPLRVLGADISYWDCPDGYEFTQANWNTAYSSGGGNRVFVQLRATRGGTTGVDQTAGYPYPHGSLQTNSYRYDDPRFFQNMKRALAAGMQVGPYHRGQEVSTNTGTDEADHMIQMAGPWMRPGYTVPMLDWEDGGFNATQAQWAIDFSDKIFAVMQIRPCVYIGGANSQSLQQDASMTQALRDGLAKPATLMPSVTGTRFYMLWNPRYTNVDWQIGNPKDTYSGFYGPWDDYGNSQPWSLWQYGSSVSISGFNGYRTNHDGDICHGDIEYMRNYLVPAVWWNDSSGDWSTLANWNSGQTPTTPSWPSDQPKLYETATLPTPRLPGASGSGPTSGQYDTVILERPSASITATLSSGNYNIRKLYMRETLNITGGSLTINYNPAYRADDTPTCVHAGPISAQFSGSVTLSGSATLSVNTLQVDAAQTFTLGGGTLAFNTINLMPDSATPAKIAMSGDVSFNASAGVTATITNGTGTGSSGRIDLSGGIRAFNVTNGVGLFVYVPISNGALTKTGVGTICLGVNNSYSGATTISSGTLALTNSGAINSSSQLSLAAGATFDVSALASPYNLSSSASLSASGTGTTVGSTAAAIKGASGGIVNLGSRPIALTYDGSHPALYLSQGALQLQGNAWTVNASPALNAGTYAIVQQASASVTNSGSPTVSGTAIGSGRTASIRVSGGNVNLVISNITTTTLATVATPQTYGTVTFSATVSPSSAGGTVTFKDGATILGTGTLSGGTAVFTPAASQLTVAGSPHSITAAYGGDSLDTASTSSASPLSITARSLTAGLTGAVSKTYDGTTAAALAPSNYSLPGIVSGDTVNLNNPASGTYDTRNVGSGKTVSVTGLAISGSSSGNYTLSANLASGAIGTITALTTSCVLASSINPSAPGTNVTFTATVNGVPPAADLPTGNVVFSANGTPFATNALVSGGITAGTATLPPGTNTITARYVGDGNFLGSTGSLAQVVKLLFTCSQTNTLLNIADNLNGTFTLTLVGTPQADYFVLVSPDAAAPMTNWAPVLGSTNTVTNVSGIWQVTVTNTAPQQFYRGAAVVPCP